MAYSDKDIYQKERALRFCVANGLIPFLEVNVTNVRELTDKPTFLTDVDALGIRIGRSGAHRTVFDCKTANKTSPINRAFWAAGLLQYIHADEAFVILQKSSLEAHRLSAKAMNVHLFDESLFDSYANASSIDYNNPSSYLTAINNWLKLRDIYKSNVIFSGLDDFIFHRIPLEDDFAKSFRGILSHLRQVRGELDPSKQKHMAIYCHAVFSAAYALTPIVNDFFDLFDPKQPKEIFESFLRSYIWGGRDSYQLRRKLRALMATYNEQVSTEVELHHWEDFIEIFRSFLDAPQDLPLCCLPLMDLTLRYASEPTAIGDATTGARFAKSNRIRQFIFRLSSYIFKACSLPKDFDEQLRIDINELMLHAK